MNHVDIIGDIHGHADELEALLKKMGYEHRKGSYAHPERKVLFVGDYIDRGPKVRETLEIVRGMVDAGNATALMGNHEYNALCYHLSDGKSGYLREHSHKNVYQHHRTLEQFALVPLSFKEHLEWFMTLPLFIATDRFRAVHACWDPQHIEYLDGQLSNGRLTEELLYRSAVKGSRLHEATQVVLTGKEVLLPEGYSFRDKEDHERKELRIKWWMDPSGSTYKRIGFPEEDHLPDHPVDPVSVAGHKPYPDDDLPVFFGHYWLKHEPLLQRANICCLDYSVAKQGKLLGYRSDGERVLEAGKLVFV